jgi:ABC-type sugar transport system ATPase subunit
VIILDEPTRGLDVGSKVEIYRSMEALAEEGVGILMISSEPEEVVQMSDRVLVMRGGKIVAELSREAASVPKVLQFATGTIS